MIRVIAYDPNEANRNKLRLAVDAVMASQGCACYSVTRVMTCTGLLELVERYRTGFFDLVVCLPGDTLDELLAALRTLRDWEPDLRAVIVAESAEGAQEAASAGVSGYCLVTRGSDAFNRMMVPLVRHAMERHGQVVGMRSDKGVVNVLVEDVQFVESSKKGAVVHLASGETLLVRTTLQALYEKLPGDGSFAKAGNSFIVNLESVRSFGDRAVIFSNGESIIVPVRVRKPLKEMLLARCQRAHGTD